MNILLLNHYAGSPKLGMEYRPYYLAREWTRLGHQVTIVAASYSHVRTIQPEVTQDLTAQTIDGIQYLWLRTPSYAGNGGPRAVNIFTYVMQARRLLPAYCRTCPPDIVIGSSTYPLDMTVVNYLARQHNAVTIYEVHDLWPLSLIELGGMSTGHPFVQLMQWAENYAYTHADYVVSMLPEAAEHMQQHGMRPEQFVHIPNGIVMDEWQTTPTPLPELHDRALSQLAADQRFIVGYVGAHGIANGLHAFVKAAALIKEQPITFVLVGQGPEKDSLMQLAAELGATNVLFLPPVPKTAIPTLLARMDALYIGLQQQPLFRFGVSPNKLMDYMMAGRPVIYAVEAGNDPVAESRCGVSIPAENPIAIAQAAILLMQLPAATRAQLGQNGHEYVVKHNDYTLLAQQFLASVGKVY